ncbi:MAG: sigma factor-like helix-turn-helix DNA-binding protein [Acutalibacteraceae bacterium]|nr:sigma factor-like helix-turn-helix DNA-binding protein [Acutalibacteraceae bacterium]
MLHLSKKRREVLLLRFYLGYNDAEIGRMFGPCRSAINRRKHVALRLL